MICHRLIRVTKIFPKTTISLLKEYRGSISGDGPIRMDNGIVLIRNHRGEHVIRSINEDILRQRIPTYNCEIGHIVEYINNYDIRNSSSHEVHSILRNEILTSMVTRPRRVNTRRASAYDNGIVVERMIREHGRHRFLLRITDENILRQRIPSYRFRDGFVIYSINGIDITHLRTAREVNMQLTSRVLTSIGARSNVTESIGVIQEWDYDK